MKNWIIALLLFSSCHALSQRSFMGAWEGKIELGGGIRMILRVTTDTNGSLKATMESPDQGSRVFTADVLTIDGDSINLKINSLNASYNGKMINDSMINGILFQGMSIPLPMKKITRSLVKNRPQNPKPPYPYKSEDIHYKSKDGSIIFGATITIPQGKGPFPAIVLLTGSGTQNRNEEIMEHKPFLVIADYLTRNGYIVLRADDRGAGETTGAVMNATTRDFANDAEAGLDYLLKRTEVDKKHIGLLGHSEGGMIAQIVAAERKDVDFMILLAGPGIPTLKLMQEQNNAIFTKNGYTPEYVTPYMELYTSIIKAIPAVPKDSAYVVVKRLVDTWVANTRGDIVVATTGITDDRKKDAFVREFVSQVGSDWYRYFLSYDPAPYFKKIKAKVLALNGDKDIQVISKSNLAGLRDLLKDRDKDDVEIIELPGLNHLFQLCSKCTIPEYGELEETINTVVLELIVAWMKKNV